MPADDDAHITRIRSRAFQRAFAKHWEGPGDAAEVLRRHDAGESGVDAARDAELAGARRAVYSAGADDGARARLAALLEADAARRRLVEDAIAAAAAEVRHEPRASDGAAGDRPVASGQTGVRRTVRLTPLLIGAAVVVAVAVFLGGLAAGMQVRVAAASETQSPAPDPRLAMPTALSRPQTRQDHPDANVGSYLQVDTFRLLTANSTASVSLYAARSADHLICLVAVGVDDRVLGTCSPAATFAKAPLRLDFNVTHDPTDDSGSDRRLEVVASWSYQGQVTLVVPGVVPGGN